MQLKLFFLAVLLVCSCESGVAHIVTSFSKMPLLKCMDELSEALQNRYCPILNEEFVPFGFQDFSKETPLSMQEEINNWYTAIRDCCLTPCTIAQVMSICSLTDYTKL